MTISRENFATAFYNTLEELRRTGAEAPPIRDPLSPASRFGQRPRSSLELIGQPIRVAAGTPRILFTKHRTPDLRYLFGQTIWFLTGSDDVSFLSHYNPKASEFSHDGTTLCGSFGKRLFGSSPKENQVRQTIQLLRQDPGSRRAYLSIINKTDLLKPTKETPCSCGIQFFIRGSKLDVVCTMRAQHALNLLPNDAFLFMTLQAVLASELGLESGSYTHFCNTLHIYEDEIDRVDEALSAGITEIRLPPWTGGIPRIATLKRFESAVRSATLQGDARRLSAIFQRKPYSIYDMSALLEDAMCVVARKKLSERIEGDDPVVRRLASLGIEEKFL